MQVNKGIEMRNAINLSTLFFLFFQLCFASVVFAQAPPDNDNWANTIILSLPSISTTGTNVDATTETGEPDVGPAGASVWWSFVAPFDAEVSVDTFGSDFDTMLHIYTGWPAGLDQLTLWDSNDDAGGGLQSFVSFPIFAGERYEIRVSGYNGAQGNIVLNGPSNDNWPRSFPVDFPFTTVGHNVGATTQVTEPDLENPPVDATVWWDFIAPQNGIATVDTFGSDFDTVLHVYSGFAEFFAELTLEATNDDSGTGAQSRVTFAITAGQKYHIRVAGYIGDQGNIVLRGSFPPPNDDWADTINVNLPFSTTGTNVGATTQVTEPDLGPADATVWWNFYAPFDGTVVVNTFGSDFDTMLHIYSGWPAEFFAELTLEAANDDAGEGRQSEVIFDVVAGERYEIRVAGFNGDLGNIVLNGAYLPPVNDDWTNSIIVELPFTTTGSNIGATTEVMEPDLGPAYSTVWWSFFAPQNGSVTVNTFGSDFDTMLHIYSGWPGNLPDLTLIADNDDAGGLQSEVFFDVVAGQRYEIRVAGYNGAQGHVVLNGEYYFIGGFVPPAVYTVFRGREIEGTLDHFFASDDFRARYQPSFTLNSSEAPVWLIFDANAPSAVDFQVESNAGTPGLTYTVEAWNWVADAYDVIGVQEETFNIDTVETFPIDAPNINGNGDVRSRVGWRKTGFTLNYPWEVRIDQVGWNQ